MKKGSRPASPKPAARASEAKIVKKPSGPVEKLIFEARASEAYDMIKEKLSNTRRKVSKYEKSDTWMSQILAEVEKCLNFLFDTSKENSKQSLPTSSAPNSAFRYWAISQAMLDWYSSPESKDDALPWTKFLAHTYSLGCLAERLDAKYHHIQFETALSAQIKLHSKQAEVLLIQTLKSESDSNRVTGRLLEYLSKLCLQYKFTHLKELVESRLAKNTTVGEEKPKPPPEEAIFELPEPRARLTPKSSNVPDEHINNSGLRGPFVSTRMLQVPQLSTINPKFAEAPLFVQPRASSQAGPDRRISRAGMSIRTHIQTEMIKASNNEGVASAKQSRQEKKKLQLVETIRDLPMLEAAYRLRNLKKITLAPEQMMSSSAQKTLPQPQFHSGSQKKDTPVGGSATSAAQSSDQGTLDLETVRRLDDSIIAYGTAENSQNSSKETS